ncbi:MFS transporter, partial [Dickeya dianthicola]|nr:MFS transporter [Dickeya dianthicola]
GAVVLGAYADRAGRKASLLLSISLMLLGGAMITFMPTYASIGLAAPVLIMLARLIQGFSAGGEFATRASGMAISYNVAVTVFGGFAPFICTLLISATGSSLAPSYYLMITALLSVLALWQAQQRQR